MVRKVFIWCIALACTAITQGSNKSIAEAQARTSSGPAKLESGREYTVAEVKKVLPAVLSKAAIAHGLGAHNYDKEAEYISRVIETCAVDNSNLTLQLPDPKDPEYAICQRRPSEHLHLGTFEDITLAGANPQNPDGTPRKSLARGDLMMNSGPPLDRPWRPGDKYTVALKIFIDFPRQFDELVSGILIKGLPPSPSVVNRSSRTSNAPSPMKTSQTQPEVRAQGTLTASTNTGGPQTLDAARIKSFSDERKASAVLGMLYFIRLNPEALQDRWLLHYFITLNNCDNPNVGSLLQNEFEAPKLEAFYRSKAAEILAALPNKFSYQTTFVMGQYNVERGAFQLLNPTRFSLDRLGLASSELRGCSSIRGFRPPVPSKYTLYMIKFNKVVIDEVPMAEAEAREYVAALSSSANRVFEFNVDVEILPTPPSLGPAIGVGGTQVDFRGRVTNIAAIDRAGKTLATWTPEKSASFPSSQSDSKAPSASMIGSQSDISGSAGTQPAASKQPHSAGDVRVFQDYSASCDAGDAKACEMTGYCFLHGSGVDKDPQKARDYYVKSCSLGRNQACREIRFIKVN